MKQELEKLDKSMKNLSLNLMKYSEVDPKYKQTLTTLAEQYKACKILLALADDGLNNTYYFKYCNISEIEALLSNSGYIEKPKKTARR